MKFITKNLKAIIFSLLFILVFFATRLINLKILPIFTDEAIYSFWSQVALHDPTNRYISLIDGKQPLFIWFGAVSQFFIKDPFLANRLISVMAGFGSLVGIYLLTCELFEKQTALISAILYTLMPFTLFYDRIGLFDSLLTMIGIYIVFLTVKMIKKPSLDLALLNGMAIGLGEITKSSANLFLYLLPFSVLLLNFKQSKSRIKLIKWLLLSCITFFLSFLIFNSLRLSPLFYIIAQKNLTFIRAYSEVIHNPFEFFQSNFLAITGWVIGYIGYPLFLVFLFGSLYGLFKKNLKIVYLLILVIGPFMAENFFNKVLYPRFVLFYFPYMLIIISFTFTFILKRSEKFKNLILIILGIFILIPAINSFWLILNPLKANLPTAEASQYRDDWPAGYGVDEIRNIIDQDIKTQDVYVGTEGTFGLYPFALNIYYHSNNRVHVNAYWPVDPETLPADILGTAKNHKTYFIFNFTQKEISNPKLKFIAKYKKGNGDSYMRIFEVLP